MKNLFYCKNIGWIIDWSDVIRFGVIRINVNRVRIFVIPNYRIFATNFFNFRIIFALIIFENVVASKVFNFTFFCSMQKRPAVCEIQCSADGLKYVAVACTVRLWESGHYGFLLVHSSVTINIPTGYGNTSTTIQTPEGVLVLITVSRSGCLVGFSDGCLNSRVNKIHCVSPEWVRDTYQ